MDITLQLIDKSKRFSCTVQAKTQRTKELTQTNPQLYSIILFHERKTTNCSTQPKFNQECITYNIALVITSVLYTFLFFHKMLCKQNLNCNSCNPCCRGIYMQPYQEMCPPLHHSWKLKQKVQNSLLPYEIYNMSEFTACRFPVWLRSILNTFIGLSWEYESYILHSYLCSFMLSGVEQGFHSMIYFNTKILGLHNIKICFEFKNGQKQSMESNHLYLVYYNI